MAGFFPWPFALDPRPDIGVMLGEYQALQTIAPGEILSQTFAMFRDEASRIFP